MAYWSFFGITFSGLPDPESCELVQSFDFIPLLAPVTLKKKIIYRALNHSGGS
jgi:hypothetical protein